MQHLPQKPVAAVIFTHSHIDHFGGATGIRAYDETAQLAGIHIRRQ